MRKLLLVSMEHGGPWDWSSTGETAGFPRVPPSLGLRVSGGVSYTRAKPGLRGGWTAPQIGREAIRELRRLRRA